ncbi:MAG: His/Gly/Thr/Pro-type tRNA ligase C-terminal domain-containing protein [Phycisphaerales bacterium]
MGDVVISLVMQDKGLMPDSVEAVPDVFIIASSDTAAAQVPGLATKLRQQGIHARFSYKTTRNVGKLLKDAATCNARFAVIVEDSGLQLKDLTSGEQAEVSPKDLADRVLTSRNAV